jgi:hypothetical protein
MIIREALDFERGRDPKDTLQLGRKVILKLRNGYRVEGFLRNKKEAEYLIRQINVDMWQAYEDAENEGQTESVAMDRRDDVFYNYEKQLEEIGFKLVDE